MVLRLCVKVSLLSSYVNLIEKSIESKLNTGINIYIECKNNKPTDNLKIILKQ